MGVTLARQCDRCKGTTTWEFTVESEAAPAAEREPGADLRNSTRAPLKLTVKVMRQLNGANIEDVCETINVSRNGVYFLTSQNYQVGELIKIDLPFKKGDLALPVGAKVVRQDQPKGTLQHAVAVHTETAVSLPEKKRDVDLRTKGRVPLELSIKVTRQIYGTTVEDFSQTINISRTGAYFQTPQNYNVGEIVQVVLPYKEGQQAIPVPARVIRIDQQRGSYYRAVALHMGAKE